MKLVLQKTLLIAALAIATLAACKKDSSTTSTPSNNNNNNNNTTTADSVSLTKKCYEGSGAIVISNMGFSGFSCNIVCASYSDVSHLWPGTYQTTLAFANQTGAGQVLNFVFNGKSFPKTGTYKAVTMYGMMGATTKIADDEVVIHFLGPICAKTSQNNTISVTNSNGKITITSPKIELFDIAGNAKSVVTEVNLTRTTTAK